MLSWPLRCCGTCGEFMRQLMLRCEPATAKPSQSKERGMAYLQINDTAAQSCKRDEDGCDG
jgi:hypothetical protein